ncbi:UNVERIFIED_CONTAM: hypothetical protein FKN15_063225 [Acipenser sinensis]
MARLSTATRHKVVILHQQGLSQAEISRQTGVSRCAVQALLKKHKETGNVEDRRRSGRPRKLTAADERHIMLTSLHNRKMSSSAISSELAENSGTLEFLTWADTTEEHGFVLVSFGAGVKYLSDDIAHTLAGALGRLPQKVIWRFSGTKPSNLGNNTKLVEWMPQNDLLGHSNIKAFLSHGGLNSIYEAMYHGVPVVGIPLFGDHYDTMTRVQAKGMGILLEWKKMTEEELYQSMVKVIQDSRYRQDAQLLSQIHKDQPGHPVSRTVYWINYILRHNGAKHLHSAVHSIPSYQYFLLDIALVMLVGTLIILYTLSRIVELIAARVWSSSVQSKANGYCHNGIPNGKHRRNGHIKHDKKVK